MTKHPLLGVGLYAVPEAARLLRVPSRTLHRWTEGYTFAGDRFSEPLFARDHPELASRRILTFQDLMELFLLRQFRNAGISLQKIRKVAHWAAKEFHTSHPLAVKRFHTDGKQIFAEVERQEGEGDPDRAYLLAPTNQYVFSLVDEFFLKLDYEGDLIRYFWPLGKGRPVVVNPARAFGQPTDPRSGVPSLALADMHAAGESLESVARWFCVDLEAVRAAVEYREHLAMPSELSKVT